MRNYHNGIRKEVSSSQRWSFFQARLKEWRVGEGGGGADEGTGRGRRVEESETHLECLVEFSGICRWNAVWLLHISLWTPSCNPDKRETEFKKIDFQKDQTFKNMTRIIWQCNGAQYMYTYIVKIDVTFNDFFQEVQLKFAYFFVSDLQWFLLLLS